MIKYLIVSEIPMDEVAAVTIKRCPERALPHRVCLETQLMTRVVKSKPKTRKLAAYL